MSDTNDMVKFRMPDGTEVSNDPRFGLQEALQKQLDSTPNKGDAGISQAEWEAQHQSSHLANLNSTQQGVGENATLDDPTEALHGPLGSPAQQTQKDDVKQANEAGASPKSTSVKDAEPVDSNERVLEVRKAAAARFAKAQQALADAGEEEGSTDKPYREWSGKQLKAEVARRNADGRNEGEQLKIARGMKVADVARMLEEDDRTVRANSTGVTGAPVRQEDLENADTDSEDPEDDDSEDDEDEDDNDGDNSSRNE